MLRFDPFSDLDALTRGLLTSQTGSNRTPRFMPMDLCKIDVAHGGALKSITVDAD